MPLVTVKNQYQVVIPQSIRKQVGVKVGDLLEAKAENGKITLVPKVIIDRPLAEALAILREDAQNKGTAKLTRREINAAAVLAASNGRGWLVAL